MSPSTLRRYEEELSIGRELIETFRDRFPAAMVCLEEDLQACLQCLRFPKEHHQRVRTTNVLERLFGENRRRVKVIPPFFDEKAGMNLIYATLIATSKKWRGVRMTPLISRMVDGLWKEVFGGPTKKPGQHDRCRGTYTIDLTGNLRLELVGGHPAL